MKRLIILMIGLLLGLTTAVFMSYAQEGQSTSPQKTVQGEVAADSDKYVIGPEDVLYIHVWKEEALTRQVPVRMDGKISLPLVDDVQAAGLTPLQLKETITRKFKQYISNPVVSVVVMEVNSFKIYVSGQVKTPGVHRLRGETTILQLIPMVGGFTEGADQKKIAVIRKEGGKDQRFVISYQKIVSGEDLGSNMVLRSGDTVIVSLERPEEEVFVSGEVKTPGAYRIRSETSLLQIIPMAGGFTEWANQKKVLIIRKEEGKVKRITVNYKKIVEGEDTNSNVILKPGDTIIVP